MSQKKHFDNKNYVYGRIPSLNAICNDKAFYAYLQKGFSDERILKELQTRHIPHMFVEMFKLDDLSKHENHQGIVLEVKPFEYSDLNSIINYSKKQKHPLILILDEIEDPHNFGAIIRSADAFGVDGIIIKSHKQVLVTPVVSKVSTGAIEYMRIAQVSNLSNAIRTLKDNGYWVYASDGSASQNYQDVKYDGPVALIVGSEGRGISKLVLDNSDFIIKIPMKGHVNSLNVSVAAGILLSRIRN